MPSINKPANYSQGKAMRLEARLSRQQKELIQHAADLQGKTLSDFIISCSQEAAKKIIHEHEIMSLSMAESRRFADAIINAPKPNTALKQALKHHENLIDSKS